MKGNLVGLSSPMALPIPQSLHSASGEYTPGWSHPYKTSTWSPVFYADGDEGGEGQGGGAGTGSDGGAGSGSGGTGDGGAGEGQGKGEGGNSEAKIKALQEEKDRHFNKRSEAEKALEAANKKLKDIEDAGKSEIEKAKSDLEEVTKAHDALTAENSSLRLELAFVTDNTYKWQNPKAALKLADLSEVEFKDGKITGLDKALEKLAKSDPYLLAEKDEGEGKGKDDNKGGSATGQQHNGGKGKGKGDDQQTLLKKYPALRGR